MKATLLLPLLALVHHDKRAVDAFSIQRPLSFPLKQKRQQKQPQQKRAVGPIHVMAHFVSTADTPHTSYTETTGVINTKAKNNIKNVLPLSSLSSWVCTTLMAVMTMTAIMFFLSPLPALALLETTATSTTSARTRGEEVFTANCASCHAGGQNFVSTDRTLDKTALLKYGIGIDSTSILKFVTQDSNRHKSMVFFRAEGGKLTQEQWQDVSQYVSEQVEQW